MARSYANVITAIWRDDDFRKLACSQQRTYLMLVTQSNISAAGTLPLTLVRWASNAADSTPASLRADLEALGAARFVVVDEETEELLVRSFVRHDNGYGNPKRRPAIVEAAHDAASDAIRGTLAAEFYRLGLPTAGLGGPPPEPDPHSRTSMNDRAEPERTNGTEAAPYPEPPETAVDNKEPQVDSLSIGNPRAIDSHADCNRVVVTKGPYVDPTTHNPQSSSRSPRRALSRPARVVANALGCDDDDAQWIADEVHRRHRPQKLAGYLRTMAESGDLAPLLAERHPPPDCAPVTTVDPPCGACDVNRQVELPSGAMGRCPNCHPLRAGAVA